MRDFEFQVGTFHTFRAVDNINIGAIDTKNSGGYNMLKGEKFQYDGDTIVLKDGRKFDGIPQVRGAVWAGWFVLESAESSGYQPKPAGIQVSATEHRGFEKSPRQTVRTESQDSQIVTPRHRTPQQVLHALIVRNESVLFNSGDEEVDVLALEISGGCNRWLYAKLEEFGFDPPSDDMAEVSQADLQSLIAHLDEPAPKKAYAVHQEERNEIAIPGFESTQSQATSPRVFNARKQVDQEQMINLQVAPAKPAEQTTKRVNFPTVVVDDQMDLGNIALSVEATQVDLDASAKVIPNPTETVRMNSEAQVGSGGRPRTKVMSQEGQEGVAVGRILSPTHMTFTASDQNTTSTSIQNTEQGKPVRLEKFASATGDVQEARSGENLEELLPDAATSPQPVKTYLPEEEDPAYQAVRAQIPDFKWDKNRRWQDRVEDAMKYVNNPPYMKGILAVETETVREEIKKRLAAILAKKKQK